MEGDIEAGILGMDPKGAAKSAGFTSLQIPSVIYCHHATPRTQSLTAMGKNDLGIYFPVSAVTLLS
jgi:hypothetical protein